jgi:transcriptional regulator with XRE-family HTH domain
MGGRSVAAAAQPSPFGGLLRHWRAARGMSQLDLALEADVSSRHLSFIETGRARPSREMVLALSSVLDVPLRERNALLQAAGFAPVYRETRLEDPEMADMRRALELILQQHGPLGSAVAFDRRWDIVMANAPYVRFSRLMLGERVPMEPLALIPPPRPNMVRMLFDPHGLRRHIANWERVASNVLARVRSEAHWSQDAATWDLLREVLSYPGVPLRWREPDYDAPTPLVVPLEIQLGGDQLRVFSTITTLGTPRDITLQELRIESFHAADARSQELARQILGAEDPFGR